MHTLFFATQRCQCQPRTFSDNLADRHQYIGKKLDYLKIQGAVSKVITTDFLIRIFDEVLRPLPPPRAQKSISTFFSFSDVKTQSEEASTSFSSFSEMSLSENDDKEKKSESKPRIRLRIRSRIRPRISVRCLCQRITKRKKSPRNLDAFLNLFALPLYMAQVPDQRYANDRQADAVAQPKTCCAL